MYLSLYLLNMLACETVITHDEDIIVSN